MKLLHLRHKWAVDEVASSVPHLRGTKCGKVKDAGIPADRHAVNEGRASRAKASGDWSGNGGGGM